jgi:inner membrane protein
VASALTHALAAVALTKIVSAEKRDWRFWTVLAGSAVLPDADVIGFALGIGYGDLLGHRGLSHSLLFAAAWSLTVVLWEYRQVTKGSKAWWTSLGLFFVATASHGALDAMTNGGFGVAFFSPFDTPLTFLAVATDPSFAYRRGAILQWPWCSGDKQARRCWLIVGCCVKPAVSSLPVSAKPQALRRWSSCSRRRWSGHAVRRR